MKLIKKITDRITDGNDTEWNMNIKSFDWVPGVGLYGILKTYECTKDEKYLNFLIDWADTYLEKAYTQKTVNSTAPLLTVINLYEITRTDKYLKVCEDIAAWVITEAPLTREGGLEHTVTESEGCFSEQIWADTLFMSCLFLAKLGMLTNQSKYSDFAANQLKIHHKLLFNKNDGLFYHGWNCEEQNHMSSVYWGRANAWIIYSTAEMLNLIGDFDNSDEIKENIKLHAENLIKYQCNDGSFCTIINDADAYSEASATAGIIAGISLAMKLNVLNDKYDESIEKGISYLKNSISENGDVLNVSTGTPVMPSPEAYKKIAMCPTLYGQGLAILALSLI